MKLFKTFFLLSTLLLFFCLNFNFAQSDLQIVNIGDFTTTQGDIIKIVKSAIEQWAN